MLVTNIRYRRGPLSESSKRTRDMLLAQGVNLQPHDENGFIDAVYVNLQHPFGVHISISCSGGERIYTLQRSGGHAITNGLLTIQKCDSELERIEIGKEEDPYEVLKSKLPPNLAETLVKWKYLPPAPVPPAVQGGQDETGS